MRGSGVDWDLRRDGEPVYTRMYEGYKFEVIAQVERPLSPATTPIRPFRPRPCWAIVGTAFTSACWKCVQSMKLDPPGDGEIPAQRRRRVAEPVKLRQKLPVGTAYLETEAPKGQMGFMVISDGTPIPVAGAAPQQQFLQPLGGRGVVPRLPDRRRAGGHRLAGHCIGGD